MPDGLSLSTAGVVAGTPTLAETFPFTVRATGADSCSGVAPFSVTIAATPGGGGGGGIVISEFRTRGPSGGNDEFVEIYNNSDEPVDISGWLLKGSSNTAPTGTRSTVPAGTSLPGRAHFLFVNLAANGYSAAVAGNASVHHGHRR